MKKYFSQFKGVDLESFAVANDHKKDGFYEIALNVDGRKFRFTYLPEDYNMREIRFQDIDGRFNQVFRSQTIDLEQREKLYRQLRRPQDSNANSKRYDF